MGTKVTSYKGVEIYRRPDFYFYFLMEGQPSEIYPGSTTAELKSDIRFYLETGYVVKDGKLVKQEV